MSVWRECPVWQMRCSREMNGGAVTSRTKPRTPWRLRTLILN